MERFLLSVLSEIYHIFCPSIFSINFKVNRQVNHSVIYFVDRIKPLICNNVVIEKKEARKKLKRIN